MRQSGEAWGLSRCKKITWPSKPALLSPEMVENVWEKARCALGCKMVLKKNRHTRESRFMTCDIAILWGGLIQNIAKFFLEE